MGGSLAAVLVSSSAQTAFRTLSALREIVPGLGTLAPATRALEAQRSELVALWLDGKRSQAVELAERSEFEAIARLLDLVLSRAPAPAITNAFMQLRHAEMTRWQPAVSNWELLAKLAPSMGMVGTITGMIQLFRNLTEDTNMGSAISLALLATLYGVAFGAGVAGPIGHFLRGLLDERVAALDRCEQSVSELIARVGRAEG
ncbi:MAG: MotA/TolQ/ExbB proton channel family protein [Myxococcales bacterium]|nr:MotA/TolQ/ExbB proton channel family protein [Myxococcales bacterium]